MASEEQIEAARVAARKAYYQCSDWRDVARAALSAAEQQGDGWRPIETAPKDGTEFQAWCVQSRYPYDGFWEPRCRHNPISEAFEIWGRIGYDENGWDTYIAVIPTHWRPLPDPPTKGDSNVG